jgi:hypothetical protein
MSHDVSDAFAHFRLVAVDIAVRTRRFPLAEWTLLQSLEGVTLQRSAIVAQRVGGCVPRLAENAKHGDQRALVSIHDQSTNSPLPRVSSMGGFPSLIQVNSQENALQLICIKGRSHPGC